MFSIIKCSLPVAIVSTFAACSEDYAAVDPEPTSGGLSFSALHSIDSDVSAVEFSIIDTDNDGLVDVDELADSSITYDD